MTINELICKLCGNEGFPNKVSLVLHVKDFHRRESKDSLVTSKRMDCGSA